MLRFITSRWKNGTIPNGFQYIPCYGLSKLGYEVILVAQLFQYIPCYGLSRFMRDAQRLICISIHPMLRFILETSWLWWDPDCISIHPMLRFIVLMIRLKFISNWNFNTSHVTVYQDGEDGSKIVTSEFQYIPCYGLSNDFKPFLSWHLSSFPLFYVISTFFTSRL